MTHVGLRALLRVSARASAHDAAEPSPDWRDEGLCIRWAGWPADPWYPVEGSTSTDPVKRADAYALARDMCNRCPVKTACLEAALASESGSSYYRHGMRGAMDDVERANLARSRQRRAKSEAVAEPVAPVRRRHVTHGTNQGYDAEMFNRDPSCALCKAAHAAKERAGRQERKAATA